MSIKINLNQEILGFNNSPIKTQVSDKEYRNLNVRDCLQMSIVTLSNHSDFKTLAFVHRMVPLLSNTQEEIEVENEDIRLLVEAIRTTNTLNSISKAFLISNVLKKDLGNF